MFPAFPKTKIMDSEICCKYFLHFVLFNVFRILKNKGHHSPKRMMSVEFIYH